MIITKLVPIDTKRSRVWLDEEFAFVLYKGELRRYKVEIGNELKEEDYLHIVKEILPKRAKLRGMNLLKSHTYSINQLREKLKDYPTEIVDDTIFYLESYGYLDDLRLSEEYIRIHIDSKSRRRLIMDLTKKGIDSDTINTAFENCSEYGFEQNEIEMARVLLKKRRYNPNREYASREEWQKAYAKEYSFLARKGFSSSVIRQVMGGDDEIDF